MPLSPRRSCPAVATRTLQGRPGLKLYPNVVNLYRGKTRQSASDVASRRLGQVEAYLTVREILPEVSKGADGVRWCEFSGFGR